MNATQEDDNHPQLNYVLKELCRRIDDLNVGTRQKIIIPFCVQEPEDMNDLLYVSETLKKARGIEKYTMMFLGQKEIEIDTPDYYGKEPVSSYEITYILKPKMLTKYLVESSRIAKYSLEFNEVSSKVILNNKYVLAIPDYDGPNYSFFRYVIKNNRAIIRKENFLAEVVGKSNLEKINEKPIRDILEQVLKNPELIKIFFPRISKNSTYFRNNVTVKDLTEGEKVNEEKVKSFLKTDERIRRVKTHKTTYKLI